MNYLKKYQKFLGLEPDGIIGKKTAQAIMDDLGITDKVFFGHLMGQGYEESGGYTHFRENMNYKAQSMANTWPTRLAIKGADGKAIKPYKPSPKAFELVGHPEALANFVYGGRDDLGNRGQDTNDGWFYRGGMIIQTTGRANWLALFEYLGLPPDTNPDSLEDDPQAYFKSGVFWFKKNDAIKLCSSTSSSCINDVGKKVNRGNIKSTTPLAINNEKRAHHTRSVFKALGLA